MYTELIVRPHTMANEIIYPDVARKLVAEACDKVKVPPLLFNRDENGKTIQGRYWHPDRDSIEAGMGMPPAIVFSGGKGFIRIFGLGEPGSALLDEHAGTIAMAIAKRIGSPFGCDIQRGDCKILNRGQRMYTISNLVASKKPKAQDIYRGADVHAVADRLRNIIYRGILSQARWLDEHGAKGLEHILPDIDTLDIDILEGRSLPIPIEGNKLASGFTNLTFSMNATLVGPWLAGALRSRGHGFIRPRINTKGAHA